MDAALLWRAARNRCGSGRLRRCCGGGLLLQVSVLLVVVGFHKIAHDRARSGAAVEVGILHDRGDHDFRIAARRVAHEPAVGILALLAHLRARFVAHQLRGAGLPGELDILEAQRVTGAATFVDHAVHSLRDLFDGVF